MGVNLIVVQGHIRLLGCRGFATQYVCSSLCILDPTKFTPANVPSPQSQSRLLQLFQMYCHKECL